MAQWMGQKLVIDIELSISKIAWWTNVKFHLNNTKWKVCQLGFLKENI